MQRPLAPPPRNLPITLRIANLYNLVTLIGFAVLGFGMIFVFTFVANADLSFVTLRGELERVAGRVTRVEETSASENETRVIANHYEYSVAGRPFQGVAYATGQRLSVGETVDVEYKPADPKLSRVPGMRRAMFSPFVLFVAIFPLIGFGMVAGGMAMGGKRNHLLRNGLIAHGTLKEKLPTNITVNNMPVWKLVFEFSARDGRRHEATAKTTDPSRLEDERQETLLYDPDQPSRAYLLDEAPARPQVDDRGELVGRASAFGRLILPLLVLSAIGLALAL
ncbi:MAG TPA: DUF3592 domain-containing protein [Thermoanaerobaculia bacterium]|nr:DUF3592 domain-containing protein [Thermoanaerobaculia bacterium]